MKRLGLTSAVAAVVALSIMDATAVSAQSSADQQSELRRQVERRFDVLPLRSGVALRSKAGDRGFRSIEIADGTIAIDGVPATGAELRDKLGADADLVLRLSYLEPEARQRLLGGPAASTQEPSGLVPIPPLPPLPPLPSDRRWRHDGSDRIRFGGSVVVDEGEVVTGDAVALGGSVRVDDQVTGNVVAVGGNLELGPHADVQGDAVTIGGTLKRDPGARVGGKVVDVGAGNFDFSGLRAKRFPFGRAFPFRPFFGAAAGLFALMSTIAWLVVLSVLACVVLLFGPDYVRRVGARAAAEPVKAGAIGLLAQLLVFPLLGVTVLVLIVTIIGIPLLVLVPFGLLALAVAGLIGFTAVACHLGGLVNRRFAWSGDSPYLTAIAGIVLLMAPVLIARLLGLADRIVFPITGALVFLGFLLEYLAWTVGFGAVALTRFAPPRPVPPPLPTTLPPTV